MIKLVFLTFIFFLNSCVNNDNQALVDKWYLDTKEKILKQSGVVADSTTITYNEDSSFRNEHYYFKGGEFLLKGINKGVLRSERYYSKDHNFELRKEICDITGITLFEGIVYKDHFYGLSTWRYCNGKLDHQGVRFNDDKIGIWRKWDETGKLIEEQDFGNISKLDSIPVIPN